MCLDSISKLPHILNLDPQNHILHIPYECIRHHLGTRMHLQPPKNDVVCIRMGGCKCIRHHLGTRMHSYTVPKTRRITKMDMELAKMALAHRLDERAHAMKLSRKDISRLSGLHERVVSRLLNARDVSTSIETMFKIATVLRCDVTIVVTPDATQPEPTPQPTQPAPAPQPPVPTAPTPRLRYRDAQGRRRRATPAEKVARETTLGRTDA